MKVHTMCGIAGKLYFDKSKNADPEAIKRMTDKIAHRGPDDEGIFTQGCVGLGNRRLAIIDTSPAGHMPMSDIEGKIWITFNGEIYNFLQLRAELEKGGVQFRSRTDTEVILALYRKHGFDCIKYLNGMFAFAIWDSERELLFLARDRIGKKPLKYYHDDHVFIFCSELKGILENPEVKKEVDWPAIDEYLTYNYVPHPKTGFKSIWKLPPASYMVVQNGKAEVTQYWNIDFTHKLDHSESEWETIMEEKLRESVELRLVSDVPLGAHLSGGIDSGMIVALMAEATREPVKTFSIGFKEKAYDELPYARAIAKRYGTQHHEFVMKPISVSQQVAALAYHYEEPYADSSALPSWYLAEMTRKHVTVALNGDGGDENFAGYMRYEGVRLFSKLRRLPLQSVRPVLEQLNHFGYRLTRYKLFQRGSSFMRSYSKSALDFYLGIVDHFGAQEKDLIYSPEFRQKVIGSRWHSFLETAFIETQADRLIDKFLGTDLRSSLPDDLLVKTDMASMAHSLEVRSPFLDYEFIELAAKMPFRLKIRSGHRKYLLKRIASRRLPRECIERPKQYFSIPLDHWFREELYGYLESELFDEQFLKIGFEKEGIRRLLEEHVQGKQNHDSRLWSLLMLKSWLKAYDLL